MRMTGVIKKALKGSKGNPCPEGDPHSFIITADVDVDSDGNKKEYFAHLGDLKLNEAKLYGEVTPTVHLKDGDRVAFEVPNPIPDPNRDPWDTRLPTAINVEKIE